MRGERERDFVPPNVDVRMVTGLLGQPGEGIHEADCGREILELKGSRDRLRFFPPIRNGGKRFFNLGCAEFIHEQQVAQLSPAVTWNLTSGIRFESVKW